MKDSLSEMSFEKLWQLFPIALTEPQDRWMRWYMEEKQLLLNTLKDLEDLRIHHIGSTAVDDIWAKPIIDILLEINPDTEMELVKDLLETSGYFLMSESVNRMFFNKGYTKNGFAEKVYHLHLRYVGDNDELYFRDFLNNHPAIAKKYEELKLSLWKQYEYNREGYTNAKGKFIHKYTMEAKRIQNKTY